MPTPTYTPLATTTLGSSATEVVFDNIPNTYKDLVLVFDGSTTSATANVAMQFNNITSGYQLVHMYGTGSTEATSTATSRGQIQFNRDVFFDTGRALATAEILDYSDSSKNKIVLIQSAVSQKHVQHLVNRLASNIAVSKIRFFTSDIASGSIISLYGIEA